MDQMRNKSFGHSAVFQIGYIKLLTGLFDQFVYLRIVHMTDTREKVMFHLEIQSSQEP
jgi:hypothetical protein